VTPIRRLVVQDDEITDPAVLVRHVGVVRIDHDFGEAAIRKQRQQSRDAGLYQVNTGGLERFDESAGQADRHTVPFPEAPTVPGPEFQETDIATGGPIQLPQQPGLRNGLADELAAVDIAVSRPMLKGDPPAPTRDVCCSTCVWQQRSDSFTWDRYCPVAG